MMAGAKAATEPEPVEAPYGYTIDEATGLQRPKKAPGRPRKTPSVEDLKARQAAGAADDGQLPGDRPPAAPKGRARGRAKERREPKPAPVLPQKYRNEGSIAKAVNRTYRKAGRILVAMGIEPEGRALIEITRAEDEDDLTVGDAWEALCRSNPRVRAFLLRFMGKSDVAAVVWAHMPVLLAFLTRDGVMRRMPFGALFAATVTPDEDDGEAPEGGLREEDAAQMAAMVQMVMDRAGTGVPERGQDS